MDVIWRKVWFDLWHGRSRTILAVLSIASGLFAMGAIFGMVDQLLTGMDSAHKEVQPSHVNLILRSPISDDLVEELRSIDGIVGIDAVNQVSVRYRVDPSEQWKLGTLVQRADYENQIFDLVVLNEGKWPEAEQIGVERLSSQYYGAGLGEEIQFEIAGQIEDYEISGLIRHPFVQPPLFGGQAHFFASAQLMESFGIPQGRYIQLLVQIDEYRLERARDIASDIRQELALQGIGVVVTLYQDPERHWGRMFVEGITLVMQLMAIVSVVVSVVLVLNTMTAIITQQIDQIGVLKAIGGNRRSILVIYLSVALFYGLVALLIALPLSAWFAYFMSEWFLNLFNIEYAQFQISGRAVLLQILAALLAPLLAAVIPVWRGANITVRHAIATYGIGDDFHSTAIDRAVEKAANQLASTYLAAALGNIFRRKERLSLTLLVLTTAGVMFLIVMSLIASTNLTLDNEMARQQYDVRIGLTGDHESSKLLEIATSNPEVREAEVWFSRNATILRAGERLDDSAGLGAQLIGLPQASQMYRPIITAGRWFEPEEGARVIVISAETAEKNEIQVGDSLRLDLGELGQTEWEVIGMYRVIYGSGFVVEPIYAPLTAIEAAAGIAGIGTQLYIRARNVTDAEAEANLSDELQAELRENGYSVDFYTTSGRYEQRIYADNQFNSVIAMLLSLAMLVGLVGGLGLMGSLGISVVERRREIGILRAIGARSSTIIRIFILEGLIQGMISFGMALPIAYLLAQPMARMLGQTMLEVDLDYSFHYPAIGIWFAGIMLIAVLAAVIPAINAIRVSVRESLAYS